MDFNVAPLQSEAKFRSDIRLGAAGRSGRCKINDENPKMISSSTRTIVLIQSEVIMAPGRNAFTHRYELSPRGYASVSLTLMTFLFFLHYKLHTSHILLQKVISYNGVNRSDH